MKSHVRGSRGYIMSKVKSKDTKPEMTIRKYLHNLGLRYRLHSNLLPGTPDLTFKKHNCVVFVNGCFWHGHSDCGKDKLPKTNRQFWVNKIEKNRVRDLKAYEQLRKLGYRVIVVWECELKPSVRSNTLKILKQAICE